VKQEYQMKTDVSATETVVRNHLRAFVEQRGIDAILAHYDENARFYTEAKIYRGRAKIQVFFTDFIGSLPDGAIDHFTLRSIQVEGNIAFITWSVSSGVPLGTDTLVVESGKIVAQSFDIHAAGAQ
jgi:ketosteroid isomerase-like protein